MPKFKFNLDPARKFFRWFRDTIDVLCDRPDHMQRLFVIGFGLSTFPLVAIFVHLLVRYGDRSNELAALVVPILGNGMYGALGLMALGAVVLLGLIKGIGGFQITTPGGINIGIQTTGGPPTSGGDFNLPTIEQTTTTTTVTPATPATPAPDNKGAGMEGA